MKKLAFLLICIVMNIETFAQTSKFFLNGSTAAGTKGDGANLKQLSVSFPVPSNVSTFDCYFISLHLSSLDVAAYIYFDKDDIKAKLTGKKEYKADILKPDGSSDFTFDDNELSAKDLTFLPRIWNLATLDMELEGTGNKIIGYHWEESYDEDKAKWIKTQVPDWDEGETHGSGTFELVQRPTTDGIEDATGFLHIKPASSGEVVFGEPDVYGTETTLSMTDNSLGVPVEFTWCVYDASEYPKSKLLEEMLLAFNGKETQTAHGTVINRSNLFGAVPDAFKYFEEIAFEEKETVAGRNSASVKQVNFSGVQFDHLALRQRQYTEIGAFSLKLKMGLFTECYFGEKNGKSILIVATAKDVLSDEFLHTPIPKEQASNPNPAWFSAKLNNDQIPAVDALIQKTVINTVFLP